MKEWEQTRPKLATARRVIAAAPHRELCEGCGAEVNETRNVLVGRDKVAGIDTRTQQPVYAFEAFKALCQRCRRLEEQA